MPSPLSASTRHEIIRKAFLSRMVDEKLLELFSHGKIYGTVHTCIGQEFSGAVVGSLLEKGDSLFSNHRCHGHFLSFVGDTTGLIAEIMGKTNGVCGGKGGSQHLCKDGFYSNGIQGGIAPVTAGLAFARKLRGNRKISVVFIGDGTLGEGLVYETLNIASKWNLPVLFVLENNGYSQSTEQSETLAGEILDRAKAFAIQTSRGDTWNWEELYSTAKQAVDYVRNQSKPAFLQIDTFRLKAHSKGDDNRPRSLVEPFEKKDPLNLLLQSGDPAVKQILSELEVEIGEAVIAADKAPYPTWSPSNASPLPLQWMEISAKKKRMGAAINEAFKQLMARHENLVFIGEDVMSPYGGAFKISQGLSDAHPDRVKNTPISEAAIVGIGTGLAMEGFRPFVEIMFGDFMTLTLDQLLNHAAKFEAMYQGQVKPNLVVRTPMGGGRGYGPTHSQTLDKHFLGIPGLRVVAVNSLMEPEAIYSNFLTSNTGPTVLIENKRLYGLDIASKLPEGFRAYASNELFPTVHIKPLAQKADITLLGYGGVSDLLIAAAETLFTEHDLIAQILCPTQIYPFDVRPLLPLLRETSSLAIVEEGQGFGSFGSEILAQLAEHEPSLLSRVRRIGPPAEIIPACAPLEKEMLPSAASIVSAVVGLIQADGVTE